MAEIRLTSSYEEYLILTRFYTSQVVQDFFHQQYYHTTDQQQGGCIEKHMCYGHVLLVYQGLNEPPYFWVDVLRILSKTTLS